MIITCSVCLNDLNFSNQNISVVKCGHIFHHDCLQEWIQTRKSCPECRSQIGKNSLVKKIYPKVSEDNINFYNGNLSESKALFELLAKNNECSQKAVMKRVVDLEDENKNLEVYSNKLKVEVRKLQNSLEISQSNNNCLNEVNCNLKISVQSLEEEMNKIEMSVDDKIKKAVKPYLQMKKEIESYKQKINLINNLTSQLKLENENIFENIPSNSKG